MRTVAGALAAVLLVVAPPAAAKVFQTGYLRFQIPDDWACALEGAEWVCQRRDKKVSSESIIIIAAKLRGDQDTLASYLEHLRTPRRWTNIDGGTVVSRVLSSQIRTINGHSWVDAIHHESEVPGFRTRYCATVISDIGVVATFSVRATLYERYLPAFEAMLMSLEATPREGGN